MSKCDLTIELDRSDRTYRPGDRITGRVLVDVNAACTCNGLTITRHWRTHGRGNQAAGGEGSDVLFTGEWQPGEEHAYPFDFEAPAGPYTYHGHYLNIDWYLTAAADIPWAFDPKAEEEVLLEPAPAEPGSAPSAPIALDRLDAARVEMARQTARRATTGCGVAAGCLFFGIGVTVALITLFIALEGETPALIGTAMGCIFALVGAGVAYMTVRNVLAQRKLGPVEASLEPSLARPGDRVICRVAFSPKAGADLNAITARISGRERVVRGSGTNKTTYTHEVHERSATLLAGPRAIVEGEEVSLETTFELPEDAPYSFVAPSNSVSWSITVHIDIARWPDWSQGLDLQVVP